MEADTVLDDLDRFVSFRGLVRSIEWETTVLELVEESIVEPGLEIRYKEAKQCIRSILHWGGTQYVHN